MKTTEIRHMISRRLKALREEHNLSQEEVARRAGLSLHFLQVVESKDPSGISVENLQKIAQVFDMPLWRFLRFDD